MEDLRIIDRHGDDTGMRTLAGLYRLVSLFTIDVARVLAQGAGDG